MIHTIKDLSKFDPDFTTKLRLAIVRTDYHRAMVESLEKACRSTLEKCGVPAKNVNTLIAPGSWEIPLLAKKAAQAQKYDAIIAFGVIVKGETYHFEMIANECARGMMQVALEHELPVINEVLAVSDISQAEARSGDNETNKGIEAAVAAIKMTAAMREL